MAGRDHAGVAPARPSGDLAIALHDHDLVAVPLQLMGGCDADAAASKHDYAHGGFATAVREEAGRYGSADSDAWRSFIAQTRSRRRRRASGHRPPKRGLGDQSTTAHANKQSRAVDVLGAIQRFPPWRRTRRTRPRSRRIFAPRDG